MKNKMTAAVLLSCLLLTGCGRAAGPAEETMTCLIPDSYFIFTGTDADAETESLKGLGPEYCTSAVRTEEGIEAELTEAQRDRLIERNNEFIRGFLENYAAADSAYTCEEDPEYRKLTFCFDEKIPIMTEMNAVFGTASGYCLNQILLGHQTDWGVEVTICNCHTQKEVISMDLPEEKGSFGPEEWEASYDLTDPVPAP